MDSMYMFDIFQRIFVLLVEGRHRRESTHKDEDEPSRVLALDSGAVITWMSIGARGDS
jgi:hypothetical protein